MNFTYALISICLFLITLGNKRFKLPKKFLLLVFLLSSFWLLGQDKSTLDSIKELRQLVNDGNLSYEDKYRYAEIAYELSAKTNSDSIQLKSGRQLSLASLNIDNYSTFKDLNLKNVELSLKLQDSTSLAYSYHDLAWYYDINYRYDSAYYYYYNAQKLYSVLEDAFNESLVFLNMAVIQEDQKDYIGAEKNAFNGIRLIEELPREGSNLITEWRLYNILALISQKLKQYDQAFDFYDKTLELGELMRPGLDYYAINAKNNIGNLYNSTGEYQQALRLFEDITNVEDLPQIDIDLYIIALSNLARTKTLVGGFDSSEIRPIFELGLKTSDSVNSQIGRARTLHYLSDFYATNSQIDSALFAAKEVYTITKNLGANELMLDALRKMADLDQSENAKNYLNEYLVFSDSLLDNERAVRNKFARIEYETDQLKAEKEKATRERQIFLISSIALLVTLLLIYVIITQRAKNKELEFVQKQQEANEEIYNLMLAQQDKIDEGRTAEKKRISEELHDGVLGRLFGTRLSLDSLNFVNTDEAVKTRGQYIEELKSIEQEIRKISHDLNADFVSGRSFTDILKSLVESQMQAYGISYDYQEDHEIDWDSFSNKTKIHVYRMLQETMHNVYKHADASHVKISFDQKNDVILLSVIDNGKGFNTNKARKGIGLKNFDSRANEIGGKVEIFSNPDQGTTVKIHIPRV